MSSIFEYTYQYNLDLNACPEGSDVTLLEVVTTCFERMYDHTPFDSERANTLLRYEWYLRTFRDSTDDLTPEDMGIITRIIALHFRNCPEFAHLKSFTSESFYLRLMRDTILEAERDSITRYRTLVEGELVEEPLQTSWWTRFKGVR